MALRPYRKEEFNAGHGIYWMRDLSLGMVQLPAGVLAMAMAAAPYTLASVVLHVEPMISEDGAQGPSFAIAHRGNSVHHSGDIVVAEIEYIPQN